MDKEKLRMEIVIVKEKEQCGRQNWKGSRGIILEQRRSLEIDGDVTAEVNN